MKILLEEASLGREFTALEMVWNSPDVVVPARTITAPTGGDVREPPRTSTGRQKKTAAKPK